MLVTLTDTEQAIARFIAKKRHAADQAAGIVDRQMGDDDPEAINVIGAAGELAFCKASNLWPDLQVANGHGGKPAGDCTYWGSTFDIKTTKRTKGRLLARPNKATKPADFYVLVVGDIPTLKIVGWISADDLFQDRNLTDLGHGPTYAVTQNSLKPCGWLK